MSDRDKRAGYDEQGLCPSADTLSSSSSVTSLIEHLNVEAVCASVFGSDKFLPLVGWVGPLTWLDSVWRSTQMFRKSYDRESDEDTIPSIPSIRAVVKAFYERIIFQKRKREVECSLQLLERMEMFLEDGDEEAFMASMQEYAQDSFSIKHNPASRALLDIIARSLLDCSPADEKSPSSDLSASSFLPSYVVNGWKKTCTLGYSSRIQLDYYSHLFQIPYSVICIVGLSTNIYLTTHDNAYRKLSSLVGNMLLFNSNTSVSVPSEADSESKEDRNETEHTAEKDVISQIKENAQVQSHIAKILIGMYVHYH